MYWIEEIDDYKHSGYVHMKMQHSELLDGDINGYIKSPHFKVTDFEGNEITEIISKDEQR